MRRRRRGCRDERDGRIQGHSYPQAWYEDALGALLAELGSLDDLTITEAVRLYGQDPGRADELALVRIEHQREEASQRLAKTLDIGAWQATMLRLDAEVARQPREDRRLAPAQVVAYLRSLPALWADSGPEGRRAIATALFASIEVEGYQKMEYALTPEAIELGLSGALPAVLEVNRQIGEFGRGERASPFVTHVPARPPFVLVNRTRTVSGRRLAVARTA